MPKKLQRRVAAPRGASTQPVPQSQSRSGRESTKAGRSWFSGGSVTPKILTEFTSQLAVLLDAGIPVTKCLRILEGQFPAGEMQRTVGTLVDDVEGGTSLSEAMGKHPRVFDSLYTNMVRAGEAGGIQETILNRLAGFMEASEAIKSRVKGALAYPVAVVLIAILVLAVVFIFVIPEFKQIFAKHFGEDEMPATTQLVINTGEHLQQFWWAYLLSALAIYGLHRLLVAKVPAYHAGRDKLMLKIPFFGSLINKTLVARFSRTFGTLIQSGVPHLDALDIVEGSVANVQLREAVQRIHGSIREGAGIAVPMGESGIFDDIVVNMVDVGEQTGELDRMLDKIADRYEVDVDRSVDATFKLIEPVLLVVLAVVVGFIVFALFEPLLKLMDKLK